MISRRFGAQIDSYDVVCRMNEGGLECLLDGNKDIVGSKTGIWFCTNTNLLLNCNTDMYTETVAFPIKSKIYRNTNEFFNECKKTLNQFNNFNRRPSCGILSIFYLSRIYEDITICGFDGFKGGHWFGNMFDDRQDILDKQYYSGESFGIPKLTRHQGEKEMEYISSLVKEKKIKML